jgi:formylglycine-generating enzyme required for sulfatase activity
MDKLGDFLGTGRIADQQKKYWEYKKARDFVHALKFKGEDEWYSYCRSGKKPSEIPTAVRFAYKGKGWKGMGDWLGTGNVANKDKIYQSFEEARKYARSLKLSTSEQWLELGRLGKLPPDIPSGLERYYKKKGWKGYGDFLGTGNIAPKDRKYQLFDSARACARSLGLTSKTEWEKYCRAHKTPNDIPTHPDREYKDKGWSGWGDWLGAGTVAPQNKQFLSFQEAREIARSRNLTSLIEWQKFCTSGEKPENIHSHPDQRYKKEWKGWGDWLGTDRVANQYIGWSIDNVKKLLQSLIIFTIVCWIW